MSIFKAQIKAHAINAAGDALFRAVVPGAQELPVPMPVPFPSNVLNAKDGALWTLFGDLSDATGNYGELESVVSDGVVEAVKAVKFPYLSAAFRGGVALHTGDGPNDLSLMEVTRLNGFYDSPDAVYAIGLQFYVECLPAPGEDCYLIYASAARSAGFLGLRLDERGEVVYQRRGASLQETPLGPVALNTWYGFYTIHRRAGEEMAHINHLFQPGLKNTTLVIINSLVFDVIIL